MERSDKLDEEEEEEEEEIQRLRVDWHRVGI